MVAMLNANPENLPFLYESVLGSRCVWLWVTSVARMSQELD
jgi:hypothetical protein